MKRPRGPDRHTPRNAAGKRVTLKGEQDRRHDNVPTRLNDGRAYQTFEVVACNNTVFPFQVYATDTATGERKRFSLHTSRARAEANAELDRLLQPDRTLTRTGRLRLAKLTSGRSLL